MKIFRVFASCIAAVAVAACATHPLPEQFEGYRTVEIVEHIRCEALHSIEENAIAFLRNEGNNSLATYLASHPDKFYKFDTRLLNAREMVFYKRYIKTGIAMDFTFDITEENQASTQLDFLKLISNGTFSLAVSGNSDHIREASRQFVVTDTFENLLDDPRVCRLGAVGPNIDYPVTGSIGLAELIGTFIQLNQDGIAIKPKDDKAPVFADTLMFTTTYSGSVTPKVTLTPAGRRFSLADASLTTMNMRKDFNKVIVGLSLAPGQPARFTHGIVGGPFGGTFAPLATVFAKRGLSEAEILAVQAISQTRIDTFYDRFGQVIVR